MPDIDFFDFFRYALGTVVTVYAVVVTLQSLYGWYVYLSGSDKYMAVIRRYLLVHGLRLRVMSFWGDVAVSILLTVAFFMICHAHGLVYQMDATLKSANLHGQRISKTR